jgi:hypothetical protein
VLISFLREKNKSAKEVESTTAFFLLAMDCMVQVHDAAVMSSHPEDISLFFFSFDISLTWIRC